MNYNPYGNYGYQPNYIDRMAQYQPQTMQQNTQQINQGLLWVQGEAGAKSYLVAPNTTVLLMDSEDQKFYLKSTDGAGMPSMRVFEYKEITNAPASTQNAPIMDENKLDNKYVTREEYEDLKRKYSVVVERLDSINVADTKQPKQRKGAAGNEQSDI